MQRQLTDLHRGSVILVVLHLRVNPPAVGARCSSLAEGLRALVWSDEHETTNKNTVH